MKTFTFFGDSFTSGENNGFKSFVDYLDSEIDAAIIKYGESGTCIGNYSLYPVKDCSLLSMLYGSDSLDAADAVFLEFGINDAAAVYKWYTSTTNILIDLRKAIDYIQQNTNAGTSTYFIRFDEVTLRRLAKYQVAYLQEYYQDLPPKDAAARELYEKRIIKCYDAIADTAIKYGCKPLFIHVPADEWDTDNLHPTDAGYRNIAQTLRAQLNI